MLNFYSGYDIVLFLNIIFKYLTYINVLNGFYDCFSIFIIL